MEFKQLEAFVAVVDYGSFSEAARRLYLTQPTISAHIRSLEDELHMKLIIRTTKKTTITAKGYQLYDSAVRMLEIRNNLLENFTGAHKHMIDLAASTIPSSYLLPELLAAFGKTHPDVYFHSIQSDSSESISRVLDGTVDLALVGQNTRDESCVFIPFCHDELVIATPVTDHYLALKDRETPAIFHDFLKDPIIFREKGSGTKKEMDLFLERTGITTGNLNVIARMNDLESIKSPLLMVWESLFFHHALSMTCRGQSRFLSFRWRKLPISAVSIYLQQKQDSETPCKAVCTVCARLLYVTVICRLKKREKLIIFMFSQIPLILLSSSQANIGYCT